MIPSNLLRNIVGGVLSWFLPLVVTIVVTPLVVHRIGIEMYGVYALALAYANTVGTLNIAQGLVRELAAFSLAKDAAWRGRLTTSALALSVVVGAAGTTVLLLGVRPYARASLDAGPLYPLGVTALFLAVATVPLTLLSQAVRAVAQGMHRFDVAAWLTAGSGVVAGIGMGVIVARGGGVVALLNWNIVVNLLLVVAAFAMLRPLLGHRLGAPSGRAVVGLARFSGMTTTSQILTALWILSERTMLALYVGAEGVALFVVPLLIGAYMQAGVGSATLVLMPVASQLDARDHKDVLRAVYWRATKVVALIVVCATVTLIAASRSLLGLWLGPEFAARAPVLQVLAIAFGLNTMLLIAWHFSEGLNRPSRNTVYTVLSMIVGVALLALLVRPFGLMGAAWARTGAMLTAPIYLWLFERTLLGGSFGAAWRRLALYLVPAGAAIGLALTFGLKALPPSWISLVGLCLITLSAVVAALWHTAYFDSVERQWITDRLQSVLGRRADVSPSLASSDSRTQSRGSHPM